MSSDFEQFGHNEVLDEAMDRHDFGRSVLIEAVRAIPVSAPSGEGEELLVAFKNAAGDREPSAAAVQKMEELTMEHEELLRHIASEKSAEDRHVMREGFTAHILEKVEDVLSNANVPLAQSAADAALMAQLLIHSDEVGSAA